MFLDFLSQKRELHKPLSTQITQSWVFYSSNRNLNLSQGHTITGIPAAVDMTLTMWQGRFPTCKVLHLLPFHTTVFGRHCVRAAFIKLHALSSPASSWALKSGGSLHPAQELKLRQAHKTLYHFPGLYSGILLCLPEGGKSTRKVVGKSFTQAELVF